MSWPTVIAGGVLCAGSLMAVVQHAHAATDDPNARDLQHLVAWYEGEFDNQEQVLAESDPRSAIPATARHERHHLVRRRVELPEFGRYVFYTADYRDDDPQQVFRQRVVAFESAGTAGVRMKLWFPRHPEKWVDMHLDPSRIAGITRDDVLEIPGCDVYWVREGEQYVGGMRPRACVWDDGKGRRYSQFDVIQSASAYWQVDSTYLLDSGRQFSGPADGVAVKSNRAAGFTCAVTFSAGGDAPGATADDQTILALRVHNQGGKVAVRRNSDGTEYLLTLRSKESPYRARNSDLMLLSLRRSTGDLVAYSRHEPEASLLGFNVGWAAVFCERDRPSTSADH